MDILNEAHKYSRDKYPQLYTKAYYQPNMMPFWLFRMLKVMRILKPIYVIDYNKLSGFVDNQ